MDEDKIVERVARAIEESTGEFCSPVRLYISCEARSRWELENPDGEWYETAESRDELVDYKIIARAAIAAHKAALAEAGMAIVPKEPTMPAMEEIFGRGPVDGIPLVEAERRFRKAIEVLAAAPGQR